MKSNLIFIIFIIIIMYIISHNIYDQILSDSVLPKSYVHEYIKKHQRIRQIYDKDIILYDDGIIKIDLDSESIVIINSDKKKFRFALDDVGTYIPLISQQQKILNI